MGNALSRNAWRGITKKKQTAAISGVVKKEGQRFHPEYAGLPNILI
jgi:hypothetical protein